MGKKNLEDGLATATRHGHATNALPASRTLIGARGTQSTVEFLLGNVEWEAAVALRAAILNDHREAAFAERDGVTPPRDRSHSSGIGKPSRMMNQ
jgi:hypothetical protein